MSDDRTRATARTLRRVGGTTIAGLLGAALLLPAATLAAPPSSGNTGTINVHGHARSGPDASTDAKVCVFQLAGSGFAPGQKGYIVITGQGSTHGSYGPVSFGPTNGKGVAETGWVNQASLPIPDGLYKATLYGKRLPGGGYENEKAKSKTFRVACSTGGDQDAEGGNGGGNGGGNSSTPGGNGGGNADGDNPGGNGSAPGGSESGSNHDGAVGGVVGEGPGAGGSTGGTGGGGENAGVGGDDGTALPATDTIASVGTAASDRTFQVLVLALAGVLAALFIVAREPAARRR